MGAEAALPHQRLEVAMRGGDATQISALLDHSTAPLRWQTLPRTALGTRVMWLKNELIGMASARVATTRKRSQP